MNAATLQRRMSRRQAAWRALWAAVLLLHVPASWSVFADFFSGSAGAAGWPSVLLLSASNLFFLLEVLFAPSLRILTDRRKAIIFLLIIALLHVGVIERACPWLLEFEGQPVWILLFVTVVAVLGELRAAFARGRFVGPRLFDGYFRRARSWRGIARGVSPPRRPAMAQWLSAPSLAPPSLA